MGYPRSPSANYRPRSLAKQEDNALGSVRRSVRPPVCLFVLSRLNKSNDRSKVFVCVSVIRGKYGK